MKLTTKIIVGTICFLVVTSNKDARAQTCVTSPPGLVSCWPADANAKDIIGTNDGTLENGTTFAPGLAGNAFSFDGIDDFANIPDSASLDALTSAITVDVWVNPQITPNGSMWIFARRDPLVSEGFSLLIGCPATGCSEEVGPTRVLVAVGTTTSASGSTFQSTMGIIKFGQWQHIVATADTATGQVQVFRNSQAVPLTLTFGPSAISGSLATVSNLFLGRRQSPTLEGQALAGPYQGLMDELKLYNRALTAREVTTSFLAFLSQALGNQIQAVIGLNLNAGLQRALVAQLDTAVKALQNPNSQTNTEAAAALQAFINTVASQAGIGITQTDSAALIAQAEAIMAPLSGN